MGVKSCQIPPYQGGQGGSLRLSAPPLSRGGRGDPPAYRHPPYQGGQGRSPRLSAPPLSRGAGAIPPPIGTPLIKGGRGDQRQNLSSI
ncbi:MAG: hypothetical protein EWV80_13065 [Microcystis aeruginosa Ma_QC_B_20070730_S2]|uniref:Uncharacterized protein n=1 Tax=Microcystis aeruginosa Ma_QC_B_20070730_S2 TaxID=2486256 RepID=A0A552DM61_MICAE|nr:MAG: hypothetical protein EWV80_13065 [Microcystis aeruginosa Ma_QC_B_20070730_S2]